MTITQQSVKEFLSTFQPYRKRYIKKQQNPLFKELDWHTEDKFLSDYLIGLGLEEVKLIIGYFSIYSPAILGIDIDYHTGIAWLDGRPNVVLLNIYNQIVEKFGYYPSLVFKSPRGIHIFYRLSYTVPFSILELKVKERLGNIKYELKPTPRAGLRMPSFYRQLDPKTLGLTAFQITDIQVYHPIELFFEGVLPEANKPTSIEEKRARLKGIRQESKINKLEETYIPFNDGWTNESYCSLAAAYYFGGLEESEAVERFQNVVLFRSPGYRGGLRNENELRRRIKSSYRNLGKNGYEYTGSERSQTIELDMFDALLVEKLVDAHPFERQRTKAIQRFLEGLCRWISRHDTIYKDKNELARWDYFYKFYRVNRKRGYYPLPFTYMRKFDHRYYELVDWLKDVGFLTQAPFEYFYYKNKESQGVCRYYKVDRALIVESDAEKLAKIIDMLKSCGLTQVDIAKGLCVNRSTVYRWLSGKVSIPKQKQEDISTFLGV